MGVTHSPLFFFLNPTARLRWSIAYKKWVLAIGQKVAEAAKEHGVAVSEPEKTVLSEASTAFGMGS
ncbi:MAG: hypothetical protein WCI87_07995 [Euryarchaeota archaeon]